MKVLIACEESQEVCKAFRAKGHEAYSNDIQKCSGGVSEWHILMDSRAVLNGGIMRLQNGNKISIDRWDLIIAHPECTYLTVTGNRWFNEEKYGDEARERKRKREAAAEFFMKIANANCDHIAIENPVGYMNTHFRKPDQIIQPYMFGDPFEKKTCLWLKNLPELTPTDIVDPPPRQQLKSGKSMPVWYSNAPHKDRAKLRSKTFPGFAKAMAEQWG